MVDIGTPNLVIQEKIDLKIYKKTYTLFNHFLRDKLKKFNYFFGINIKRFVAEDVYSIYASYDGNNNATWNNHTLFSNEIVNIINNKIKLNKIFIRGERDYTITYGILLFHHSEINTKFRDTKYLFSYLNYNSELLNNRSFHSNRRKKSLIANSYALFLNFDRISNNYKIKTHNLIKLSFIKNIEFGENNRTKFITNDFSNEKILTHKLIDSKRIHPTISYSDFFIKFNKLDQFKNNQEIATIYWKPNNKSDIFEADFKFDDKSYIKMGANKYSIFFKKSKTFEDDKSKMRTGEKIEVGKLILPEYVSYDFKKEKIIKEGSEFSSRGLLIPFNFKGDFFYKLHLGINKAFDGMDFYVHQAITQKTLDPYEGKIRIEIETNSFNFLNEIDRDIHEIKSDDFKELIDLGELINPLAIIRISSNGKQKTS